MKHFFLFIGAFLFLSATGLAQVPANDVCANAIELTVNGPAVNSTNVGTVTEGTNPSCGGTGIKDVWYKFVYTGGTISITTGASSGPGTQLTDPRLAVYPSCGGAAIACDDDDSPNGNHSLINFGCPTSNGTNGANEDDVLVVGTTYYIQAGGYNNLQGVFSIQITGTSGFPGCTDPLALNFQSCATVNDGSCIYTPANDVCSNAIPLTVNGASVNGWNIGTVTDGNNPSCGGTGIRDVWYSFVYNGQNTTISTAASSNSGTQLTDTRIAVYSSCGGAAIACDDNDGPGNYGMIKFGCPAGNGSNGANEDDVLVVGSTYYIQVGGFNATTGIFSISVTSTSVIPGCTDPLATNYVACATQNDGSCTYPLINDICADALTLTVNGAAITVNNSGTTNDGPNPSCGGTTMIKDLWYKFVYTGGNISITTTLGTNTDTRLAVYSSCGGALLACDDDDGPGNAAVINFGCPAGNGTNAANEDDVLIPGNTYYIQAGGYNAVVGTFTIAVTSTIVSGCTNPNATNYNTCATVDDGSCTFPPLQAAFTNYPSGVNCLNIQFDDQSQGNLQSWSWSFPGGTPSASTLQNPIVTYPSGGLYTATLTVTAVGGATNAITQNVIVSTGHVMTVDITADNLPQQTTWSVFDASNNLVASGTSNDATFCIADECHRFELYDSGGNGICCGNGNGSYTIYLDGLPVTSGGTFGYTDTRDINCPEGTSCNNPLVVGLGTHAVPQPNTWYEFTPAENGQYKISTCGLASCDTHIWVYDYCFMANFDDSEEATYTANDDFCGVQAQVTPYLQGGQTYYIRVGDIGSACGLDGFDVLFEYMGPIVGCMDELACNYSPLAGAPGPCYYNNDPNCSGLGPDLLMRGDILHSSLFVSSVNGNDACLVNEGCIQAMGTRQVLKFTTRIENIGNEDYFIGVPNAGNPQFVFDGCHNHYHYQGYAEYLLFEEDGTPMPQIGFKNGFCVLDLGCTTGIAKFGCGNMGITAGCYDVYSSSLSCQWIDITDVPAGDYHLVVRTNWDQDPDALGNYELAYDNNWAQVCIHFDRDVDGNIINFTKSIGTDCIVYEDCIGQPFGSNQPDCAGNCPYVTKRGDLDNDGAYTYDFSNSDVADYLEGAIYGNVPVSLCTDLNNDGVITVSDGSLLDACIHSQFGTLPSQMTECAWDDVIYDNNENVTLGIQNLNTTGQYFDVYIINPNGEVNAMQFDISGATIDHVESLVPFATWQVHIHDEDFGNTVVCSGHIGTNIPVNFSAYPILRIYYDELTANSICVANITEVLNDFLHRTITNIGDCQQVAVIDADFEASAVAVCTGAQVTFTDLSLGNPTQWSWTMPGATPSASTAQNPVVNYYTAGTYAVTLTASNALTNDTEVKTAYITVTTSLTQYIDADGDGYGNSFLTTSSCVPQVGYVLIGGDCNDNNNQRYPGAEEVCNGFDDDCDGQVDEGFDADGDGYTSCGGDCDDNSAIRHPGALELCNNLDDDCDGQVDEGFDADNDGWSVCEGDCNDNNSALNPGQPELCNGVDDNCNGVTDEGYDLDGDGFTVCEGDCNDLNSAINPIAQEVCNNTDDNCDGQIDEGFDVDGDGWTTCEGDCDDGKNTTYPGAIELCGNGEDDDCDGFIDEGYDLDGDGFQSCEGDCDDLNPAVYPGAPEVCNGIDDDCNGQIDEGFDQDNDGFTVCEGDCDDTNAAIRPGIADICGNLIDDDCDGFVDEGCGGGLPNDDPAGAVQLPSYIVGGCSPVSGDLSDAAPSPFAETVVETGEDIWYSFTAMWPGIRIDVQTAYNDILIELQDADGNLIDSENIRDGIGAEILNYGALTEGETYYVGVRNVNSDLGSGPFTLCLTRLQDSRCDYGPGPYSLCSIFKADHTGASQYTFHFTSTTTSETYSRTLVGGTTQIQMGTVPGMTWNDTYSCVIDAGYMVTNGMGDLEMCIVPGNEPCPVIINPHPDVQLRLADRCPITRLPNSIIGCSPFVCGLVQYQWEFTQVSPSPGLPFTAYSSGATRFLNLYGIPGIVAPATFSVRVRPVFPNGIHGSWGTPQCLQLAGSAGMVAEDEWSFLPTEDTRTGVDELQALVYPNPFNGRQITVMADEVGETTVSMRIYDSLGRVVYQYQVAVAGTMNEVIEFAEPLGPGVYMLELRTGDRVSNHRIVVQK